MFLRGQGTADKSIASSRLILIGGGVRAGKSRFAQQLGESGPYRKRIYVATAVACDRSMRQRIARHRRQRGRRWVTWEEPTKLPERILNHPLKPHTFLLIECLPTFLTNLLMAGDSLKAIQRRVGLLVKALRRPGLTVAVVTNEVGCGIIPASPIARQFQELLGWVNQTVARSADEVWWIWAGIPIRVK